MTYHKLSRVAAGALALLSPGLLLADSISPSSVAGVMGVGDTVTIHKTVTVDTAAPTSSAVDVYFLADTTGSMSSYINAVRNGASSIMSAVAGFGDVRFAVGEYKDFPISPYGGSSDFAYRLNTSVTANTAAVQAGINMWSASGGADGPESQLAAFQALSQVSEAAVGWRTGSEKILVWFGDWPGHDKATEPAYPGPTKAAAISALQGKGIQVEAINVYGTGAGIDEGSQASQIAAATGGHLYNNISSGGAVTAIINAITTAFATYSTVGLDISEAPAGVAVSVVPGSYTGSFDRSVTRNFEFDVTFTGVSPGSYGFNVYGTVDGGRVATETDRFTVTGSGVPDGGSTLLLLGGGLMGLAALRRRM